MEDKNVNEAKKKSVNFHSDNIADTKAKEKREFFVKVQAERKTVKQSAEEFQRKFAAAKAHAAESRAKIENPGADANGMIRSRKRFSVNWRKVAKVSIPATLLIAFGVAVYLNWGVIYHEFFEISELRASELSVTDPVRSIAIYDALIRNAKSDEEKASYLLSRAITLNAEYTDQIRNDVYEAERLYPSVTTAEAIIWYEETYGSDSIADEWRTKLPEREMEGKEIILGNG